MSNTLVSVIIVTYNARQTLQAAIKSFIDQQYLYKELIIIDGNSTDGTNEIINEFRSAIEYFVSEPDNGIYDAMNKGIAAAKGEWLFFLGADDVFLHKNVLSDILGFYDLSIFDFLYGNVRYTSDNRLYGGSRTYTQLIERNINHQSIFFRKAVFDKLGSYSLKYPVLSDYDKNLQIFNDDTIKKQYLPIDISLFNNRGGASNIKLDFNFFSDKLNYFITEKKMSVNSPLLQHYNFYFGYAQLVKGNIATGLKHCFLAFISGKKKVFYCLLFCKYIISHLGIGPKVKIV
ncbi:MAG: glycosyltransferase family 2 protein [Ferruginibacter sp.]